jgi:hypothetical protein
MKKTCYFLFLIIPFALLLHACSTPDPTSIVPPTIPGPIIADPTAPIPTTAPSETTALPYPEPVISSPEAGYPHPNPTAFSPYPASSETTPENIVEEHFSILTPDTGSLVISPVSVFGVANPTFEQNLVVMITDENGNQLALTPTTIEIEAGQRGSFSVEVPFTVSANQPGRIVVYEASAMNGALVHLSSVEVTLIASGEADIKLKSPVYPEIEQILILSPEVQATLTGGVIEISGMSAYFFEGQLNIIVCGQGGSGEADLLCGTADNVVGTGLATIDSPDIGLPGTFSGSATYTVTEPQVGQVIVYAISARDGGVIHAVSVLVNLEP